MHGGLSFEEQLEDAETALAECIKTHGEFHERVSYKLDAVAKLLRSKGIRIHDAANMEAKAKSIRIGINTGQMKAASRTSKEIVEAMSITAQRRAAQRRSNKVQTIVWALVAFAVFVFGAKFVSDPANAKLINSLLPTALLKNIEKEPILIQDTGAKTKEHNEQVDQILNEGGEGASADGSSTSEQQ
jgi:hypothetical protein